MKTISISDLQKADLNFFDLDGAKRVFGHTLSKRKMPRTLGYSVLLFTENGIISAGTVDKNAATLQAVSQKSAEELKNQIKFFLEFNF